MSRSDSARWPASDGGYDVPWTASEAKEMDDAAHLCLHSLEVTCRVWPHAPGDASHQAVAQSSICLSRLRRCSIDLLHCWLMAK